MIPLFLFDIDGVLVEARGYLRALQDTVAHFARQMGLGDHAPSEAEVRAFEAAGLSSEWDSAPACVGALLLARLRREPAFPLPARWPEALIALAAAPCPLPRPDYARLARRAGAQLAAGLPPARAARAALEADLDAIPGLGPARSAAAALLETLLGRTHDFYAAPVTRHFQHLAIGSRAVAEVYGVSPDFESSAYLAAFERPLLDPRLRDRLNALLGEGRLRGALYTARPSRPPAGAGESCAGYSPEAELARALVGLDPWPLAGRGGLLWLARRSGEDLERLAKPSPVHALAAIGAAWSGQEAAALQAALALGRDGRLLPPLAGLGPAAVHLFEDGPGGLESVGRAVAQLRAAGLPLAWQGYGIAPAGSPKAAALAARGAAVYPTVNDAVGAALAESGACPL